MIKIMERLGDRVLGLMVPTIAADAAGTAACVTRFCYCTNPRSARYRTCCDGVCGGCNLLLDC